MKKHQVISFKTIIALILCLCFCQSALSDADVLKIPAGLKTIENEAFKGDKSIDEVELPDGIEEIGEKAFAESGLERIHLPASLESIANNAFDEEVEYTASSWSYAKEWVKAHKKKLEESWKSSPLEWFTFIECENGSCKVYKYVNSNSSDQDIVIPKENAAGLRVTEICSSAFFGCNNLVSVKIPYGVTTIGFDAFADCSNLTSITIPDSVTSIRDSAFFGCSNLRSITLPDGLTSIEGDTFRECSSLAHVTIPDSVKTIGWMAFKDCVSLTRVTIPEGVTSIEDYAFENCSSLIQVTIPDGVTSIESYTFIGCSSLTRITIPNSVASIGGSAFWGCSNLTSIKLPTELTNIEDDAFALCSRLVSITIPAGVTYIGSSIFYDCSNLTSIYCVPDSKSWEELSQEGYEDLLIAWDGDELFILEEKPYIPEHAKAYETWWNDNVAALYRLYLSQAYSTDEISSDHNFLLRKMAELADLKKDEDTANANQWKEKYNSEDNYWLLDDDARLRLTLTNLAKIIEEDKAKEALIVNKDLQNVSLVSLANQEVALVDNKMARIKDASEWAINAIQTAVSVYSVQENMEAETTTELSDKQKLANVFINAFKDALLKFPTAVMETLIESQAKYDAAYILRAYTQEYVTALKESCDAYADYIAETYFGSNKLFDKDNRDYYGKAVKIFVSAFRKANKDEAALIQEARNTILSGTGYTYEEVLNYASIFTDDMFSRLDKKFWCDQFVKLLRGIAKNFLTEIFDKWDEKQIIGMLDKFIVIEVKDDCSINCSFDWDGLVDQIFEYQKINSTAVMLTGIQLTDNNFNSGWALVKNEIIGKNADGYVTTDISKALKDNVKIVGTIKKIVETAWKVGEGIVKMSHELIELDQIGQGKTLYDSYGCALIDAFGQRINMRAKGEIMMGMTDEHFAIWDVKRKESQRQALISLLNLDEYIVITYKNMKTINEAGGNKFNSGYEWASDSDIEYALKTIRNIRTAIKDVPEDCQIYEK